MELIRGLVNLRARHRGAAVTVGAYDGLHLGHRALVEHTRAHASRLGRAAMVVTFEPLPKEFLNPEGGPARLTNFRERWRIFESWGVDVLCVLPFDPRLRNLSGEGFSEFLRAQVGCAALVVGHDFRFGREGAASAELLRAEGERYGLPVEVVAPVCVDGVRVSSTGVREALAAGDFARAEVSLGRPYSMRGRVAHGERLGRTLGYPTANLRLGRRRSPLSGICAVRVHGVDSGPRDGVASLGTRPTVNGVEPLLETFLFDFAGDLYGREIEVEFVAKLRDELKFSDLGALVAQMDRDAAEARAVLAQGKAVRTGVP
jgi:riboflavin kinase/FMN adenylyltransferase